MNLGRAAQPEFETIASVRDRCQFGAGSTVRAHRRSFAEPDAHGIAAGAANLDLALHHVKFRISVALHGNAEARPDIDHIEPRGIDGKSRGERRHLGREPARLEEHAVVGLDAEIGRTFYQGRRARIEGDQGRSGFEAQQSRGEPSVFADARKTGGIPDEVFTPFNAGGEGLERLLFPPHPGVRASFAENDGLEQEHQADRGGGRDDPGFH